MTLRLRSLFPQPAMARRKEMGLAWTAMVAQSPCPYPPSTRHEHRDYPARSCQTPHPPSPPATSAWSKTPSDSPSTDSSGAAQVTLIGRDGL
ncbi:hypothetical protein AALO_G00233820 [Alosa alosa]|uniref:Uncharacterized protein n=1 Tax=Alosa alosa TaxID=278164 RepID=A0AAV6FVR4_9TELE|nr:hypothetical protein AALO_G00233820 [Alosa alosa]